MDKIVAFLTSLLPLLESKAFALLVTLVFAAYIAFMSHEQSDRQRETALMLHDKLIQSYAVQVQLAKDCQTGRPLP